MRSDFSTAGLCAAVWLAIVLAYPRPGKTANEFSERDRKTTMEILHWVQESVDKNYYDPMFRGVDMSARFREAEAKIQAAASYGDAIESVEWAVQGLNDSQTYLIPPPQPYDFNYGFDFQFYGDDCYITKVKSGSDAAKQGLKAGDKLLAINRRRLVRGEFEELRRSLYLIAPRAEMHLAILPRGEKSVKELTTHAEIHPLPARLDSDSTRDSGFNLNWKMRRAENEFRYARSRSYELDDVLVWKQPTFTNGVSAGFAPPEALPPLGVKAKSILEKSRKNRALVLDLRGNRGGQFTGLQWLVGGIFDHEVRICDVMSRGKLDLESAKAIGKYAFTGMLIVLVDSETSSEAEVFARLVQLEKRGFVIGDQTFGRMKITVPFFRQGFLVGSTQVAPRLAGETLEYGVMVSTGEVIMKDGKNLDGVGVTPDLKLLPTPEDLAAGRDPALSMAISLAGHKIDPEQAGELLARN